MIVVVAKRTVKAERKEEYLGLVEKMVTETRKEPGCLSYEFCQNNASPLDFAMVEKWESQGHLNAHFETPHFKEFVSGVGDLLAQKCPTEMYTVLL